MKSYGNYLIVDKVFEDKQLASGLIVPVAQQDKSRIKKGTVVDCQKKMFVGGQWHETKLTEGCEILFNAAAGYEYEGKVVLNIEGVVAVL